MGKFTHKIKGSVCVMGYVYVRRNFFEIWNGLSWLPCTLVLLDLGSVSQKPWKLFRPRNRTLRWRSCFIHIILLFLIWAQVLFIQEVSGVYTPPFLDTYELKPISFQVFRETGPGLYQITITFPTIIYFWWAGYYM